MKALFAIIALLVVAGCGTTHATITTSRGEELMLLGFDPVAYFTDGKPVRGKHTINASYEGRTYYFASTQFEIRDGRLFIFGDILGHEMWLLDEKENIAHADALWPEIRDKGWRAQSMKAWIFKVPWYRTGRELMVRWREKHPGQSIDYGTGGFVNNMILKYPGWRAREGFGQAALGVPGEADDK